MIYVLTFRKVLISFFSVSTSPPAITALLSLGRGKIEGKVSSQHVSNSHRFRQSLGFDGRWARRAETNRFIWRRWVYGAFAASDERLISLEICLEK